MVINSSNYPINTLKYISIVNITFFEIGIIYTESPKIELYGGPRNLRTEYAKITWSAQY